MSERPPFIRNAREMPDDGGTQWAGSDEVRAIRTRLSRPLGLRRIGVHLDVLDPGHRSSLPRAEPLDGDERLRLTWEASLTDNALCDHFEWPGYPEMREILRAATASR